jgi:DNA-binding response OmpR family regulator
MRILLIEDDKDTARTIRDELTRDYVVELSGKGQEGENLVLANEYDAVIIDINLPDKNGIDVCQSLRAKGIQVPVLMLTGEADVRRKVDALDSGADDYLTKPFSFDELKARIRSLMRRKTDNQKTNVLAVDDLTLDLEKRLAVRCGQIIHIGRKEIALLEYLMRNAGRVVTRDMILNHIWKSSADPLYNTVDVHIKYLRDRVDRKFDKKLIKTVYGLGYKIEV